jgi:seryl-tRNA(Sec) selenium transferase
MLTAGPLPPIPPHPALQLIRAAAAILSSRLVVPHVLASATRRGALLRMDRCLSPEFASRGGAMLEGSITRRSLFGRARWLAGMLAWPALRGGEASSAATLSEAPAAGLRAGPDVYASIGVRPLVNARGTYTIISGSTMLPEVRAAMDAAARQFVHLDELADAIGARLATLTGAEWGLVTSGCAAALTHATAACVAGGNPDLHVRIPNLAGFPRDEAIIPKHSRNVYDAAVRAVGLRVIDVDTPAELEAAFGPRTAMIYVFAGPRADTSALSLEAIAPLAKARGVPVLVDAAAEGLTVPNVHLKRGATLVAYSGGKCLRGPQTAGLLLGDKRLVRAAWVHSAPHHGYARGMKVGKEEAIAMLMAVEMWTRRNHDAEWTQWASWLDHIAGRVATIEGITTEVVQPEGLSNHTPSLRVLWDRERIGISGERVAQLLLDGDPRVALFAARGDDRRQTGVSITPYMLHAGEERIVGDKLHGVLSAPSRSVPAAEPSAPTADLTGQWDVQIEFAAGRSLHALHLRQRGNDVDGAHQGEFVTRGLTGAIDGDRVQFTSTYDESHGDALTFSFAGTCTADHMSGTLEMGEYRTAAWTARRTGTGAGTP